MPDGCPAPSRCATIGAKLGRLRVQLSRCACLSMENGVLSRIMHKIMIIRHAEKHQHGMQARGVDEDGHPARHELTVRGWQRAGALVQLFAQPGSEARTSAIQVPRSIFASDATKDRDRKSTRLN